jgi:hypothetical protein
MNARAIFGLTSLLAFGVASMNAHASVLLNDNVQIMGETNSSVPLSIPGAGELTVTLTDEAFPADFTSLQFALSNATTILTQLSDAGTQVLDLTAPTQVFVDIFATPDGESGLYNLTADFTSGTPVPLPGSALCLVSAILLLKWRWRGNRAAVQTTVMTSMA